MKIAILDRYIAKQIIATLLVVALALLGLDIFFSLVAELKSVGKGNYTLSTALIFLGCSAPTRFYMIFPWAALLGTLISLGMLANHRELVVMRASTISVLRITWSVLKAASFLLIFVVLLGEGLGPIADRIAQNKKTTALSQGQSIDTPYGLWVRQGNDYIHVRSIQPDGSLQAVTRYQFNNERKLIEVSFSETALQFDKGWQLKNVQKTTFLKNKTQVTKVSQEILPVLLDPEIFETALVKYPERLSLLALYRTIELRSRNELNTDVYALAFYKKLMQPFLILLMVFLAVPFVFGPLRNASMGLRMMAGVLSAYVFYTINGLFAPLALVYQVPPFLAVIAPLLLFSGLGFVLLRRVK